MSDSPPEQNSADARVASFVSGLKRYRWWDERASGRAAMAAIREHVALHLEALSPFGLSSQSDAWVAPVERDGWQRTQLDERWNSAQARAAASTPDTSNDADELARGVEPAITDVLDDPTAAATALQLIAREICWLRANPPSKRSPWAPLLSIWSLGAWPVGLSTEGYFLVCLRANRAD